MLVMSGLKVAGVSHNVCCAQPLMGHNFVVDTGDTI